MFEIILAVDKKYVIVFEFKGENLTKLKGLKLLRKIQQKLLKKTINMNN